MSRQRLPEMTQYGTGHMLSDATNNDKTPLEKAYRGIGENRRFYLHVFT